MSVGTAVAVAPPGPKSLLSPEDLTILKRGKFKNFTDDEIEHAAKICDALSLNPFLNQIHFVKRRNKDGTYSVTAQTGIDGFRLHAQRAGGYAGNDEPVFEYAPNDQLRDRPIKATVTVYRIVGGHKCGFTASARWKEYYPGPGQGLWDKMPHNQLAKCAEALALRKAFPAELSALRTDEEMDQADRPSKADEIAKVIKDETVIEVESRPVDPADEEVDDASVPACNSCGSSNLMVSRHTANSHYCRDCKKTQPMAGNG
jgi:phage recombination protein Bet